MSVWVQNISKQITYLNCIVQSMNLDQFSSTIQIWEDIFFVSSGPSLFTLIGSQGRNDAVACVGPAVSQVERAICRHMSSICPVLRSLCTFNLSSAFLDLFFWRDSQKLHSNFRLASCFGDLELFLQTGAYGPFLLDPPLFP